MPAEELHMLLRDKNFPHEFRVRNGGHEFAYWREALYNGLRFISDAFEGKPYRGDLQNPTPSFNRSIKSTGEIIHKSNYSVVLPDDYNRTQRYYPILYFLGNFDSRTMEAIYGKIKSGYKNSAFPPVIVIFSGITDERLANTIIPSIEKEYRVRSGFRFRAVIGFEQGGRTALQLALNPETFTCCAVFDADIDCDQLMRKVHENKRALSRTWLYIDTTDKSANYKANGCAHIFLREQDVYHEYRVQQGYGGTSWFLAHLDEALDFTQRKIHR